MTEIGEVVQAFNMAEDLLKDVAAWQKRLDEKGQTVDAAAVKRVVLAMATPAEMIKARLIAFLEWPANSKAELHYEWREVVEVLLGDSES